MSLVGPSPPPIALTAFLLAQECHRAQERGSGCQCNSRPPHNQCACVLPTHLLLARPSTFGTCRATACCISEACKSRPHCTSSALHHFSLLDGSSYVTRVALRCGAVRLARFLTSSLAGQDPIESFLDENGLSHLRPSEFARAAGRALPAPAEARAPAPVAATSASAASAQDSPAARVPLLKIHRASVTAADEGRSVEESVPRSPRWLSADPVELTFFEQMLSDDKIHNMLIHAAPKVATSTLKDLFGKLGLRRTAPQAATPLAPSPSPVSSTSTNPSNFGDDSDDEDDRESVANSSGSMHGRQASDDWATNPLFQPIPDPMLPSPVARMQTLKAARAMSVAPLSGPSNLQQIFQPLLVAPRPVVRKFTHIAVSSLARLGVRVRGLLTSAVSYSSQITPRRGIAEASATLSLQPELPFFPFWSSHLAQVRDSCTRSFSPPFFASAPPNEPSAGRRVIALGNAGAQTLSRRRWRGRSVSLAFRAPPAPSRRQLPLRSAAFRERWRRRLCALLQRLAIRGLGEVRCKP